MRELIAAVILTGAGCQIESPPQTAATAPRALEAPRDVDTLAKPVEATTPLPGGARVISRPTDEPGETDLWLVAADGSERRLTDAPGPDDAPTVLPDGRVLFVSARSTVASLWILDPASGEQAQLTNLGLEAGGPRDGFVPPPEGAVIVDGAKVSWSDGYGGHHTLAVPARKAVAR